MCHRAVRFGSVGIVLVALVSSGLASRPLRR